MLMRGLGKCLSGALAARAAGRQLETHLNPSIVLQSAELLQTFLRPVWLADSTKEAFR